MEIIGIDPGSLRTGWGIIRDKSGILELVDCGIVRTTPDNGNFSTRLSQIYSSLCGVISKYSPEECAVEQVFTAQSAQSALKLGQARGAAVAACASFGLPVCDYEPTLVKKSVVGNGRAEKEQVAFMIFRLLNMRSQKLPLDVTDALAVAICHANFKRYRNLCQNVPEKIG